MAEGFKLLDAYVEVKADATGIGEKVSKQFTGEVAPAAKKMADAVDAATQRVAAASRRQADAASSLKIAQARLADVEKSAAPGSTALAAAQEAVAKAQRNVSASAEAAERAQHGLGSAQARLKESGASAGGGYLSGLKGALTTGAVGGIVGGLATSVASGVVNIIGSAVSDIGGMLTTVGTEVASTVIDFNSQLQNATIGFETMLGSGAKAKSFLNDLQNFAKATPFEFKGLVSNAQLLMGMGVAAKNVIPDLTALGDSVAAMGGSAQQVDSVTLAFGQMVSKGTLDMGNMTQVLQGGVPSALKVLAASYHVTTGKMIEMISAGDVQSKDALPRLVKGIEKGTKATAALGGMMDKQSSTFTGALSNIQDAFQQTTSKAFKPFFDAASKGMQRFATALSGKPVQKFTKDVERTVRPFAKQIEKWLGGIDFNKIFTSASKALKSLTKGLDAKDFGKFLKDMTKDAGDIFKDIVKIAPKVIKAIKEMAPAVMATIKQGVDFIGWLSDVVDWFDKTEKAWYKWRAQFVKGMDGFFKDADGFWNDMANGWDGFWKDLGASIAHGWDQIVGAFQHGGKQITDFFGGLPGALTTIGVQMVQGLIGGIQSVWGSVTSTLHDLAMALPEPVRKALGIASPSKVFHLIGQQVSQGLHRGLLGSVDQIKVAAGQLANAVTSGFHGSGVSAITRYIQRDAKVLEAMSKYRAKWIDKLATDQGKLKDVLSARKDFAAGVKSNVMGNADVSSIYGTSMQSQKDKRQAALDFNAEAKANNAAAVAAAKVVSDPTIRGASLAKLNGVDYQPSWTTTTPGTAGTVTGLTKLKTVPKVSAHSGLLAVKASLKKLLADTKKFASNLKYLMYRGIDPYTYDELVQAGVRGGGLEMSAELLADPKLARQVYSLERQVAKAGGKLGTQTATHEYYGKVASARAAVTYDKQEVHNYNIAMTVTAKDIDDLGKLVRMFGHVKATARKKKSKH